MVGWPAPLLAHAWNFSSSAMPAMPHSLHLTLLFVYPDPRFPLPNPNPASRWNQVDSTHPQRMLLAAAVGNAVLRPLLLGRVYISHCRTRVSANLPSLLQIVSYLLRTCVYDPLMEGRLVHRPGAPVPPFSRTRRMLGLLASFGASALLHEMLFW